MRDDPREPPASPAQPSWVGDTEGASVFPEHNPLIGAPAGFASHWSCSVAAKAAFMLERVIVPRFVGKLACPETVFPLGSNTSCLRFLLLKIFKEYACLDPVLQPLKHSFQGVWAGLCVEKAARTLTPQVIVFTYISTC